MTAGGRVEMEAQRPPARRPVEGQGLLSGLSGGAILSPAQYPNKRPQGVQRVCEAVARTIELVPVSANFVARPLRPLPVSAPPTAAGMVSSPLLDREASPSHGADATPSPYAPRRSCGLHVGAHLSRLTSLATPRSPTSMHEAESKFCALSSARMSAHCAGEGRAHASRPVDVKPRLRRAVGPGVRASGPPNFTFTVRRTLAMGASLRKRSTPDAIDGLSSAFCSSAHPPRKKERCLLGSWAAR
jgi:hypothetical protein